MAPWHRIRSFEILDSPLIFEGSKVVPAVQGAQKQNFAFGKYDAYRPVGLSETVIWTWFEDQTSRPHGWKRPPTLESKSRKFR